MKKEYTKYFINKYSEFELFDSDNLINLSAFSNLLCTYNSLNDDLRKSIGLESFLIEIKLLTSDNLNDLKKYQPFQIHIRSIKLKRILDYE